ncbi:acyltransferase domain-containing protein [Nocardiopsis sp. EMB25]|uniref:type I polyketide synthase n=1 Tax=Nocardiopsis sp. EMB25 TaxID=2835867 RepID=UPI002284FCB5|nr:type I polyketide synthase [Nocardiopsis sp. EMB25]MCY9782446.1 acyltransferase domain-containing protein [Nocardiopsis sp. EMB25]
MTNDDGRLVAALRSALKENARLREERDRAVHGEPVAVVGMACRLPGAVDSPEALWTLLSEGGDAVGELPRDRGWDLDELLGEGPGGARSVMRGGAFLGDAAAFDAGLFGISPKEAVSMDPQQRQLLEVSWEAVERARIAPSTLAGTDTGVYVGLTAQEYGPRMADSVEEGLALTGTLPSVASGRIAYTLGLHGPALTVDTACSSSLVAIHQAVRALRDGDCSMALAGGAAIMASPGLLVEFTRKGGLSPDGRCRAFGSGANGTGFSEGAAMIVLERLSDARRSGHPVLAVIRGSAVNQDGASNGLTSPSGPAQSRVIRSALADAGLAPEEVDAVEAHGTGTVLGDPIEASSVVEVYGRGRRDGQSPLLLGSLKSNVGHTQAAAGVSGVLKAVQALRAGLVPATLHAEEPTPHVDWERSGVALATSTREWPEVDRPRRIGVSSFGISGTNAHMIIEQAPPEQERGTGPGPRPHRGPVPWLVSGRTDTALRSQAARLAASREVTADPFDVGYSLAVTRSALDHRAVVVGADTEALLRGLRAVAVGEPAPGAVTGRAANPAVTAFLFSGQGAQRAGMGRGLYEAFPAFAEVFDAVVEEFDRHLPLPLRDVMWADESAPEHKSLTQTAFTQASLFTFETALYRLLESWGVRPDYVAGHSIGEITAAYVAGVMSLSDAAALVAARGRLMQALPSGGAMAALQVGVAEVEEVLTDVGGGACVAAVNAPDSVVVSGEERAVTEVTARFSRRGFRAKRLEVSHAFHSALMDPMLDDFRAVARRVRYERPTIPLVSNLSGVRAGEEVWSPDYWVRHARETVRFSDGVDFLKGEGVTAFVEVGPNSALTSMVQPVLGHGDGRRAVALLGTRRPEPDSLVTGLAELHAVGVPVDWSTYFDGANTVDLPTYAFQHRRYWLDTPSSGRAAVVGDPGPDHEDTPDASAEAQALRTRLAAMPAAVREEELLETVRRESAVLLGHDDVREVPADRGFLDLGFDSLTAVRLGSRLSALTDLDLPTTVLLDHPSPRAVAAHLAAELDGGVGPVPEGTAEEGGGAQDVDSVDIDDLIRMVYEK